MTNDIQLPITGRCLCGQVKYSLTETPKRSGLCYCRSCQIKSGSENIAFIIAGAESVSIIGPIKWYQTTGSSGKAKQHGFCSNCGSHLFGKPNLWPRILSIYASSLDHPKLYKPEMNIWLAEAPAWACVDQSLKNFDKNPS